jgi:hypothetical protein
VLDTRERHAYAARRHAEILTHHDMHAALIERNDRTPQSFAAAYTIPFGSGGAASASGEMEWPAHPKR